MRSAEADSSLTDYAVMKRFLMVKEGADGGGDSQDAELNRFIVVEHWFEELRRLVPTN